MDYIIRFVSSNLGCCDICNFHLELLCHQIMLHNYSNIKYLDFKKMHCPSAALSAAPSSLAGKAVIATKIQPQNCGDVRDYLDASLRRVFALTVYFCLRPR